MRFELPWAINNDLAGRMWPPGLEFDLCHKCSYQFVCLRLSYYQFNKLQNASLLQNRFARKVIGAVIHELLNQTEHEILLLFWFSGNVWMHWICLNLMFFFLPCSTYFPPQDIFANPLIQAFSSLPGLALCCISCRITATYAAVITIPLYCSRIKPRRRV